MRARGFQIGLVVLALLGIAATRAVGNDYAFFVAYVLLEYVVLATAWNILGGYAGYINFGAAGFLGLGTYSTVVLAKLFPELPVPVMMLAAALVAGAIGLVTGYMTLRVRGIFFSIVTLGVAVVLHTLVMNWSFVGGARGAYVIGAATVPFFGAYIRYLCVLMLALAMVSVALARGIERSAFGAGLAAIRDDEAAAEACGVPTLKLKLLAATISGGLMGMAGAPLPYYLSYVQPDSAFDMVYTVNSVAMPMIGGISGWAGPVIGALLLGGAQQATSVMFSSSWSLLSMGMLLVLFIVIAPGGLLGLGLRQARRRA
jgi:branched-chain amino acid transport system permease protein